MWNRQDYRLLIATNFLRNISLDGSHDGSLPASLSLSSTNECSLCPDTALRIFKEPGLPPDLFKFHLTALATFLTSSLWPGSRPWAGNPSSSPRQLPPPDATRSRPAPSRPPPPRPSSSSTTPTPPPLRPASCPPQRSVAPPTLA